MHLDVRMPLGLLFLTIGGVLAAYALAGKIHVAGAEMNMRCGLVMIAFGAGCLLLAHTRRRSYN